MSLTSGLRLGPYEIVGAIGVGGMGEVYKARDTRLDRTVAIKVLPPEFAADPERQIRFEREARAISQLSHPHICALFDVGDTVPAGSQTGAADARPSVSYLVMEYLEGQTLAARLDQGPLPISEVLRLGREIATALDCAHRHGIVHRDLKPANVMLATGGTARHGAPPAKLMDFGLARPVALTAPAPAESESPTRRRPLTAEGTIVGTLQYMAPEQLEGKEADARTDLWALGCVLYEMATGTSAFAGTSQVSLIAAILKEAPRPLADLQPLTPAALDRLVARCLEKDPDDRWQSARDVASELEWIAGGSGTGSAPSDAPVKPVTRGRERLAWLVAGLMAVTAVVIGAVALVVPRWQPAAPESALVRFSVTAPAGGTGVADATVAAISPDGQRLVFAVEDSAGTLRLWVRPLSTPSAQPLPGTEHAMFPFWSPDSRFVAFFADGKLRKVPAAGGPAEEIADAPNGRGGTWNADGVIVFAPLPMGPLMRVSADGGEVAEIARPDGARREAGLRWPCFLADGRHFLYVSLPRGPEGFDVYLGATDGSEPKRIMSADSAPVYAEPGFLLFARGERLVARRFDAERLQPVGEVMPLGDVAPVSLAEGAYRLSVSANGVLAYGETTFPPTRLEWLDRAGRPLETIALPAGSYLRPYLSPDDRRVIVTKSSSPTSYDLWLVDLERTVASRLTFDGQAGSTAFGDSLVVWSPGGRRIVYSCGQYDICTLPTTGVGQPEPLVQRSHAFKNPAGWSPDGRFVVFSQLEQGTEYDLWLVPQPGDRAPVRYLQTPFNEITAAISPDGRFAANDSDETGASEIYVRSFPEPGEKHRISVAGGARAQWSSDGRELLIWTSSPFPNTVGPVYSVDVQTAPTFKAGTPRLLFTPRRDLAGIAATSDLKRFLAAVPVEGATPPGIMVTLNWHAALKIR